MDMSFKRSQKQKLLRIGNAQSGAHINVKLRKLPQENNYYPQQRTIAFVYNSLNNREPQYSLALWNHNKDAAEGLARTTNAVEGWHLGLTSLFQGNLPCIWTFLEKISLDAANQKFNIIKDLSGKEKKSRKKYRVPNENVKYITKNFKTDDIVPYLRSLAYYTHS